MYYANKPDNKDEIRQAIVNSNNRIYIKGYDGAWVNNITGQPLDEKNISIINNCIIKYKDYREDTSIYGERGDDD